MPSLVPSMDSAADGAVIACGALYSVKAITPLLALGSASFNSIGVDELVM